MTMNKTTKYDTQDGPLDDRAGEQVIRVWNDQDPRSVIRLVPESVRIAMLSIPEDIKEMDEMALRQEGRLNAQHSQLRLSFWLEYNRAQEQFDRMKMINVMRGICSEEHFYTRLLKKNHHFVAFMLTPPVSYLVAMEEALNRGMQRMREIMELPLYEDDPKTGKKKINTKVADLIIKATAYMDMRKNGGIEQKVKVENKTLSISMQADSKQLLDYQEQRNMQEIDKRLEYLEKREKQLVRTGAPVKSPMDIAVEGEVLISEESLPFGVKPVEAEVVADE